MDKHLKTRQHTAAVAATVGVFLIIGSMGAYENGDYTVWQGIAGAGCGVALAAVGAKIGKEE